MNWLLNSSIGKKLIMSISGICLVLFLVSHASMNMVAVFSADAYNAICSMLGANWYAVLGTVILGVIVVVHFIYAIFLTLQNNKARGANRYAVTNKPAEVEWASQNMFILGLILAVLLGLHLSHFWYKMMFAELMGKHQVELGGMVVSPQDGAAFIKYYFSHLWVVVAYLVLYGALWFHLSHGFWSAMQTLGWSNKIWLKRWQTFSRVIATVLCLAFTIVTLVFYLQSI